MTRRSLACVDGSSSADLVEEERAPVRELEQALLAIVRAREGAALVPEQLVLEDLAAERRAVERNEEVVLAGPRRVQCPRDQLLARAALAEHEDVRLVAGDARDGGVHLGHRGDLPVSPRCSSVGAATGWESCVRGLGDQPLEAREDQLGRRRAAR